MKTDIFWIDSHLAIAMRPRGGDWLEEEVRDWKREGVEVVVSLLAPKEITDLDLAAEAAICALVGMEYHWTAIPDLGVPEHLLDIIKLVDRLETAIQDGRKVGIHSRQGLGRAPLVAACLLVRSGMSPHEAWDMVRKCRGAAVPETNDQAEWLDRFADELAALKP